MLSMNDTLQTNYLGWDRPLLHRAIETLVKNYQHDSLFDLSSLICVLPTAYSAYRFEKLVKEVSARLGLSLSQPKTITLGQLPEQLYTPRRNLAIEFEQTLAWSAALAETNPDELAPLVPTLPHKHEVDSWMELAATIRGLYEDLSSNQLSFSSVAEVTESASDTRRWDLLAKLYSRYLSTINEAGLSDPHFERRYMIDRGLCASEKTVVLIGTSDLSHLQLAMLKAFQGRIIDMIAAPIDHASHFDAFGCIETAKWTNWELPLRDEQLIAAGDIADQSTAVAEVYQLFASQFSAEEITIGVTDETQVAPIEFEMRGAGVNSFRNLGWTVNRTAIGRLLNITAAHLKSKTWQTLATLVRHADVHDWISSYFKNAKVDGDKWLVELDQLLANHFPVGLGDELASIAKEKHPQAIEVARRIEKWLAPFSGFDRPLGKWCESISEWLRSLYSDEMLKGHTPLGTEPMANARNAMAFGSVLGLLERFSAVNAELDLEIDGANAMQMIVNRTAELRVVDIQEPDDVKILGWLDLALDDANAIVVAGLNHPYVPSAVTNDAFLPGMLRTQLKMSDNERRYARDVYHMQLLLSTRQAVRFVVGSKSADGSPTPPSRLLGAATEIDTARRIRNLLSQQRPKTTITHVWDATGERTNITIPKLPASTGQCPVQSMSVTAFRDYLACPYRFYLRHVLKQKPLDDLSNELAANQFGDLVHGAVEEFGKSEEKNESDAGRIEESMIRHLRTYAEKRYGKHVSSAVSLQIRQAERRLKTVAIEQAKRIAEGWRIHDTEAVVDDRKNGACIEIDGFKMALRGRLDRIDFHPESGRWAILDYKTHGHKPEKKHLQKTEEGYQWIDLQLPLYRMMIPYLDIDVNPVDVQLGYFNISDKDEETRINIAVFDEALMEQARELILDCVRRIRNEDFQPTNKPIEYDDYAMILQM